MLRCTKARTNLNTTFRRAAPLYRVVTQRRRKSVKIDRNSKCSICQDRAWTGVRTSTMSEALFNNEVRHHHVGYVVKSIRQEAEKLVCSLALHWDGKIIHDSLQTVYVSFFQPLVAGNPTIELVEPEDNGSTVHKFLQRGGGLHHLCYEVASLEEQLEWTKRNRDLIVRPPAPAVAFEGRRIAWVYTRSKMLLEYLERCHK